jgi:tetratricopeptide (TPR) repeat protein
LTFTFGLLLEETMRNNTLISNSSCAGVWRALRGVLRCMPGLVLLLALGAMVGVRAQDEQTKPSNTDAQSDSAGSAQKRARRVAEDASSIKKDDANAISDTEATGPATTKAATDSGKAATESSKAATESSEAEDEPSATAEAGRSDRVSTLRAQIKEAKTEAERSRLRRTLVDYLVALNKKQEAVDELRAMTKEERFDPVGFYNIGNALERLGDTGGAIEAYRKAIKQRKGNYPHALNNLGVMLMRQKRWDEAEEALTSALKLEDNHYPEASANLERLYYLRDGAGGR